MRRKSVPDYEELMRVRGFEQPTASYRNMLDNIHAGCYVEAETTRQYGDVESVIRNKYGIPVCIKVRYGDDGSIDYISADRVTLWEPYNFYVPNSEYEMNRDEMHQMMTAMGYKFDEAECCYKNDNGDVIAW